MKAKARVQHFKRRQVAHMVTHERAALPCGCCIYVGRDAEGTVTTGAAPCSVEHQPITDRSSGLLRESTRHPSKRLLVAVCADILTQAAKEIGT